MEMNEIPTVDFAKFASGNESQRKEFVNELGESFSTLGFAIVANHGLADVLREDLYRAVIDFFSLPDEIKQSYEDPKLAGQRGYTGKGKEHAKGRNVGDLKEFYHVGQEVEDSDPIKKEYPENIWPKEISGFKNTSLTVYRKFEDVGRGLLQAIALYLNLPEHYFDDKIHHGNSILRPIHYYPILNPDSIPADAVRAAEHEDINLITLLMGASAEGLQVLKKEGGWINASPEPNQIVINVGDMLQRLTNNRLKSTTHRVVNPPREKMANPRYSIPFFLHPRSEMSLVCLDSCISENHPKAYPDCTAGEYLDERLREIGLRK